MEEEEEEATAGKEEAAAATAATEGTAWPGGVVEEGGEAEAEAEASTSARPLSRRASSGVSAVSPAGEAAQSSTSCLWRCGRTTRISHMHDARAHILYRTRHVRDDRSGIAYT